MSDPFHDFRRKKILPEDFKHGMNCLLDRWYEIHGREIAQKVYERIRKTPEVYTIQSDISGFDLPEIPILFTVELGAALDALNETLADRRRPREYKKVAGDIQRFLKKEPQFLQRLEGETEHGTAWRMAVVNAGLENGSVRLEKMGRLRESGTVTAYAQVIAQVISPITSKANMSNAEIDRTMLAIEAMGKAVANKDERSTIDDFLARLRLSFWNVLLEGMLSTDPSVHSVASHQVDYKITEIQKWKEEVGNLTSLGRSVDTIFDRIWNEIRDDRIKEQIMLEEEFPQESHHSFRKSLPEKMAFLFLIVVGYEGRFAEVIKIADRPACEFLFNKLTEEVLNESRMKWYRGNGPVRSILKM